MNRLKEFGSILIEKDEVQSYEENIIFNQAKMFEKQEQLTEEVFCQKKI